MPEPTLMPNLAIPSTTLSSAITFELCSPVEEHARQVMDWRNDPTTLAMFYHHKPKVWPDFFEEFREHYFQYSIPPMFALYKGQRIAFVKLDPVKHPAGLTGQCFSLSINIAPEQRGKGLAKEVLLSLNVALVRYGVDSILAEVRMENAPSLKAFAAAGYQPLGQTTKLIEDTGETVSIERFVKELTPAYWRQGHVTIIAEAGSNWRMGNLKRDMAMGKALVDVAADAGADVVKFQTYRPETTYVGNAGQSDYLADAGIKEDISAIFADLAMPYEMLGELAEYCRTKEVGFMSTGFSVADMAAIDPHTDLHKIASYENGHLRLLEYAAKTGKPTIISTGASSMADVTWAVDTYNQLGGRDLCVMQCTAKYPAPMDALNLNTLSWLRQRYGVAVGLSDHSRDPIIAPLAAVGLGARCIEKHYTLNNHLPGPDHAFAIEPDELALMVESVREAEQSLGDGIKAVSPAEEELAAFARRGLQALRDIQPGEILVEDDNVAILRSGKQSQGAHPKYAAANHPQSMVGKKANKAIAAGTAVKVEDWQ